MNENRKQQGRCKSDLHNYKLIGTLIALMILVIAGGMFYIQTHPIFVQPHIASEQIAGEPQETLGEGYQALSISEKFQFGVQADLQMKDQKVAIYLVNDKANEILLQVRIIDKSGAILAESGVVEPGYYLKTLDINATIEEETPVAIEVLGYEKDTYYSAGKVGINTTLYRAE